jgi:hypothetical protein
MSPSIPDHEGRSILRNVVILRHFINSEKTMDEVQNELISNIISSPKAVGEELSLLFGVSSFGNITKNSHI